MLFKTGVFKTSFKPGLDKQDEYQFKNKLLLNSEKK